MLSHESIGGQRLRFALKTDCREASSSTVFHCTLLTFGFGTTLIIDTLPFPMEDIKCSNLVSCIGSNKSVVSSIHSFFGFLTGGGSWEPLLLCYEELQGIIKTQTYPYTPWDWYIDLHHRNSTWNPEIRQKISGLLYRCFSFSKRGIFRFHVLFSGVYIKHPINIELLGWGEDCFC